MTENSENSNAPIKRSGDRPVKKKDGKRSKRGKGRDRDEGKKPAVPPALMRGPKPKPTSAQEDIEEPSPDETPLTNEEAATEAETPEPTAEVPESAAAEAEASDPPPTDT